MKRLSGLANIAKERIDELVVVNVPSHESLRQRTLGRNGWYWSLTQDPEVFIAQTCERTLLVTSKSHWENVLSNAVPQLTSKSMDIKDAAEYQSSSGKNPYLNCAHYKKSTGREAYRYLLETSCGLHSNNIGEEFIGSQIQEEFNKYLGLAKGEYPGRRKPESRLKPIMQWIRHDTREIRTNVIGMYNPITEARVGVELMKLPKESNTLIFADSGETLRAYIKELVNRSKGQKQVIDIVLLEHLTADSSLRQFFEEQVRHSNDNVQFSILKKEDVIGDRELLETYHGIIYLPQYSCPLHKDVESFIQQFAVERSSPESPALLIARSPDDGHNDPGVIRIVPDMPAILPCHVQGALSEKLQHQKKVIADGLVAADIVSHLRENGISVARNDLSEVNADSDVSAVVEQIKDTHNTPRRS